MEGLNEDDRLREVVVPRQRLHGGVDLARTKRKANSDLALPPSFDRYTERIAGRKADDCAIEAVPDGISRIRGCPGDVVQISA